MIENYIAACSNSDIMVTTVVSTHPVSDKVPIECNEGFYHEEHEEHEEITEQTV